MPIKVLFCPLFQSCAANRKHSAAEIPVYVIVKAKSSLVSPVSANRVELSILASPLNIVVKSVLLGVIISPGTAFIFIATLLLKPA